MLATTILKLGASHRISGVPALCVSLFCFSLTLVKYSSQLHRTLPFSNSMSFNKWISGHHYLSIQDMESFRRPQKFPLGPLLCCLPYSWSQVTTRHLSITIDWCCWRVSHMSIPQSVPRARACAQMEWTGPSKKLRRMREWDRISYLYILDAFLCLRTWSSLWCQGVSIFSWRLLETEL